MLSISIISHLEFNRGLNEKHILKVVHNKCWNDISKWTFQIVPWHFAFKWVVYNLYRIITVSQNCIFRNVNWLNHNFPADQILLQWSKNQKTKNLVMIFFFSVLNFYFITFYIHRTNHYYWAVLFSAVTEFTSFCIFVISKTTTMK